MKLAAAALWLLPLSSARAFAPRSVPSFRGGTAARLSTAAATEVNAPVATGAPVATPNYDELMKQLDVITQLGRAMSVLEYDKMVFMPETASAERGKQSAALAGVLHEKSTSPEIGSLLSLAASEVESDPYKRRNWELAKREYEKKTCIPAELASRRAALSAESYTTWTQARAEDDFSMFQDCLSRCIDLSIEITKCQPDTGKSVYATMLDEYEVGMAAERIDDIFDEIKTALVPLLDRVLGPDASPPSTDLLRGTFPMKAQKEAGYSLVRAIGYDDSSGRIDESVHPFSMSVNPSDVRITSRFSEDEWYQGLAALLHEGGHAIYEQNIGGNGEPIHQALSMGMHESQSLFWERHVGLSQSFWKYAAPVVNEAFDTSYTPQEFYGAVNAAKRSFIRVEADELTYPLHVILRYEIERDFIQGKLDVKDLPERWNKDFEAMLGIPVPSDAQGCLQDVHWSMLAYGYFPTYLIGSATAAQLAHYCQKDIPNMHELIEKGEFAPIKAWLTEKVHRHGKKYNSLDDHLEAELGEKLNPQYFIKYLTDKYTELYKC